MMNSPSLYHVTHPQAAPGSIGARARSRITILSSSSWRRKHEMSRARRRRPSNAEVILRLIA